MTRLHWLAVEPLDTVMVRDGRSFDAGAASVAVATTPPPSTLGGVIGEAVGSRRVGDHLVGPLLATTDHGPLFPMPNDLVRTRDHHVTRVIVADPDGTTDLPDTLPQVLTGNGAALGGFLDSEAMTAWLAADGDELAPGEVVTPEWWTAHGRHEPWRPEQRIGLAVRQDGPLAGTAEAGLLYAATHLRPRDGTRFLVGCATAEPVAVTKHLVPIGGRGRLAEVSAVDAPHLPAAPPHFPGGRVAVYLATPALLDDVCWRPEEAALRAIALTGPCPVATASPRDGVWQTRQLTWAVPAGTVYYLDFGSPVAAADWARRHHGGLLPRQREIPMTNAGFGTCLTGRW
ncbi:type III-B CRISPR module-associated Cmr3 family protein [Kutzneria buriramensis]|uniref:CRISPR-associated protein Cmr3 n=1 Tax=Kutzneria buriramensis TaxID=1045776 RepID=A0A3E0HLR6_9PSEU|nr:type III-B CRISPR module-associated Cmr3 family protein [Kutzneria buriramensis]REH47347.1 CRISPR-associated protein Cmr3 [Kutzneria buriramensis]